ncbi:protein WEAK CHLOROPLAST MOVEMENT UNDER BLUE LIGHT-like 1 [Quillaja saponaria]|uniref:Protein WEAK CHLOROPLAST MOVEMENT UNDER BLUE LIGHT-like 1 n=1 Tax=Quillaja saponaria TaxID=32244 RepID=A0AAD7QBR3_QUISA|nr:protein WEAK CHLOROPLAST MOVEMENT UNDER BLUE LIGHT-like 1 [Quillaja saponaria]
MGEIDTKPIEPVQASLSLFGEKGDQKKYKLTSSNHDCEKELETLLKDLANCKLQLEAKDAASMQALLKLEHYQKMVEELSNLLKDSETDRNKYMDECLGARTHIDELKNKMKEMVDQLLETAKLTWKRKRQSVLYNKSRSLTKLFFCQSMMQLKLRKKSLQCSPEKDAKIELATTALAQAEEQVQNLKNQIEMKQELENQLVLKSAMVDILQFELSQANEVLVSSEKYASTVINDLNQLQAAMAVKERKDMDQSACIETLEMELNQLKRELKNSEEELGSLNYNVDSLTSELQKAKYELDVIKEREIEAQVQIALLKSELYARSPKPAAAEAGERAKSGNRVADEIGNLELKSEIPSHDVEVSQTDQSREEVEDGKDENNDGPIKISLQESLIRDAEKTNQVPASVVEFETQSKLELLKEELEVAKTKIGELRTRTEQALSRAESAEKAKSAVKDQLRRWREHKQKRKAALAALREVSTPRKSSPSTSYETPKPYQPLGKMLNMKF